MMKMDLYGQKSKSIPQKIVIHLLEIVFVWLSFWILFQSGGSISVPFAFALYYIGYTLLVLPVNLPIDSLDYFSIALFFTGCLLNTGGEVMRNIWKQNPANKGALYTKDFFKYSRHINYFGDILWVTAYALITRNWYAVSIPVFLFCFFAFYNAPKLDKYLDSKYGIAFKNYVKTTKMLIPFIY